MKIKNAKTVVLYIISLGLLVLLFHETAFAEIKTSGVLDTVLQRYETAATEWAEAIQSAATWLFWTLATISMVWTFSQLMFHRSSLAELFGELVRFMVFTGFYLWLLRNGPSMANDIINSMRTLGNQASGQSGFGPSDIIDVGFHLFSIACDNMSVTSPLVSAGGFVLAGVILVILTLIATNMLLLMCSAWVLAYAGIFFLGFGGSKWTSDMAINYFKTVLGVGTSLMTMTLLVGIGTSIIDEYYKKLTSVTNLQELSVILVVSISLLLLVDKVPAMVSGIITGASIGSSGVGAFGAGAAVGAAMTAGSMAKGAGGMAMGAAAMGGRVALAGAANAMGLASAFQNAKASFSGDGGGGGGGLSSSMGNRSSSATETGGNGGGGNGGGSAQSKSSSDFGTGGYGGGGSSSTSSGSSGSSGSASSGTGGGGGSGEGGGSSTAQGNSSSTASDAGGAGGSSLGSSTGASAAASSSTSSLGGGSNGGGASVAQGSSSPSAMNIGKAMAKGAASMAGQAMGKVISNAKQDFSERVQNSMGGKLAETIKNSTNAEVSKLTDSSKNSNNMGGGKLVETLRDSTKK